MAGFRERDKQTFPLQNVQSVVDLFRNQLTDNAEPDLALLSIVLGTVENALTVNRTPLARDVNGEGGKTLECIFPVVELSTVEALHQRFVTLVKSSVDLTQYDARYATRGFVKKVSDVIWASLTRTYYKDKAHIQSLYSYLTGMVGSVVMLMVAVSMHVGGCIRWFEILNGKTRKTVDVIRVVFCWNILECVSGCFAR